jgi:hypothetical protein
MADPAGIPNGWGNGDGNGYGYGDSRVSLNSIGSEGSMTHFKKYDALREGYPNLSISSKGGKRQLGDMVRLDSNTGSYMKARLTKAPVLVTR